MGCPDFVSMRIAAMMTNGIPSTLPRANPACLQAIAPPELAAAFVASHKEGCTRSDAESALSGLFCPKAVLDECAKSALIEERGGLLYATASAGGNGAGRRAMSWADARREFAFRALGVSLPFLSCLCR